MPGKRVAIVTGASRGIGYEAAKLLQEAGYAVYGLSRRQDKPAAFSHLPTDIGCEDAVKSAITQVIAQEGRLDLLVCNAGFGISGSTEFTDTEQAEKQFAVNFFGAFTCIKHSLPALRQSRGRIIVVSSVAGVLPIPFQAFYSASKAALNALVLALADEVAPFGISVCALLPGDVATGFTAAREKQPQAEACYGKIIEASVNKMEQDEESGMTAAYVAGQLLRIAQKGRIRPFYVIGHSYRVFYALQKFLPLGLVRFIVRKMYAR